MTGGQDLCSCNDRTDRRSFDYWFPCSFGTKDPATMLKDVNCEVLQREQDRGTKPTSEIRVHLIHSTVRKSITISSRLG